MASRQNERVIEGFEIGHHTADTEGWLTGTTVVVARGGAVGGVTTSSGLFPAASLLLKIM